MSSVDPLALAISEWQRKHRIADGDPLVAVLDLVRLALQHPPVADPATVSLPPSFEEFRATMELLDARSKDFVKQSTALAGDLRRFAQLVQGFNDSRTAGFVLMLVLGITLGIGAGWILWAPK